MKWETVKLDKNKKMKIWDKNKPVREGCLRKICETDIEPTGLLINPKVQGLVNAGEGANFNIPIERPKNHDSRWTLIQKKREMGLVRMMLETKQQEIERLAEENNMKEDGLRCSETMLEEDTKQFLSFFNQIKAETQKATEDLDSVRKEKADRQQTWKGIEEKIHMVHNSASKNIEQLEVYNDYKIFLDNLYKESRPDKEGDDATPNNSPPKRHRQFSGVDDEIQDLKIPKNLVDILEDDAPIPEPPFKIPSELIQIFSDMEEQNLRQIQRMQDSEQQLEVKKQEYETKKKVLTAKIEQLKDNEKKNDERIRMSKAEKDALSAFEESGAGSLIEPNDMVEIERITRELYVELRSEPLIGGSRKDKGSLQDDPDFKKAL